jgi:ribosomal-protein-alanine N-acetyltransferase
MTPALASTTPPPPFITTARLTLRPVILRDAPAYFRLHSDRESASAIPRTPHTMLSQTESSIQRVLSLIESGDTVGWTLLRSHNEVVGLAGIHHIDRVNQCARLGYELDRAHWGQGLMTEAMESVVEFGFRELGLHRLEARIAMHNTRSMHLAERTRFKREGVLRESVLFDGSFYDIAVYARLAT